MTERRVLLVEDDARNAELIRLTIEPTGMRLDWARTLAEARASLLDALPDAVILDLRLPDGPGHALASEVRAAPGGERVVILAVSASVLEADRRRALRSGCDDFIEKPISPRDLVARLAHRMMERS